MTSVPPPGGQSGQHDAATAQQAGSPTPPFFRWLRGLNLIRTSDRWVGGVAGALARRTGLDLALVRGLIVVLAVFGGIGVLLYGLAWALLPEPDGRIHVEQAGRGSWTSGLSGAAVLVALGLWRPEAFFLGLSGSGGVLWTLLWIGAVVLLVYWIVDRSKAGAITPDSAAPTLHDGSTRPSDGLQPPSSTADTETHTATDSAPLTLPYNPADTPWSPESYGSYGSYESYPGPAAPFPPAPAEKTIGRRPPRPSGSATALLVGGALLVAGTLLALDHTQVLDPAEPTVVALSSAAVVLALGIMVLGARGRTSGVVGFIAALTTAAALLTSFSGMGGEIIVAQQTSNTPTSLAVVERGYSVLAAEATVDLTDLPAPTAEVVIPVNALVSDVTLIVPEDVPVEVRTRMALGSTDARSSAADIEEPGRALDDGGVLQLTTTDLNPEASGAAFLLEVDGALSDVSIITAPAVRGSTSDSPSTGDRP